MKIWPAIGAIETAYFQPKISAKVNSTLFSTRKPKVQLRQIPLQKISGVLGKKKYEHRTRQRKKAFLNFQKNFATKFTAKIG